MFHLSDGRSFRVGPCQIEDSALELERLVLRVLKGSDAEVGETLSVNYNDRRDHDKHGGFSILNIVRIV